MSWATARTAIKDLLNGQTATATGLSQETLAVYEYPPATVQTSVLPYAYVVPPARDIGYGSGKYRVTTLPTIRVRFILGAYSDREQAAKRMEAWVEKLATLLDGALVFGGAVDTVTSREATEFSTFPSDGDFWGFDLELGLRISEVKELTA